MSGINQDQKEEIYEFLALDYDVEAGNDDMVYGNYIEWPFLNKLEIEDLKGIATILNITFDEEIDKEELEKLIEEEGYEEGTEYENGNPDFLEKVKYWPSFSEEEEEYEMYINDSSDSEDVISTIRKIKKEIINKKQNELTEKALILSAFVYTEDYIKTLIGKEISTTDIDNIDDLLKSMLKNYIGQNLRTTRGRSELYKEIFDEKLPKIPNVELRNILAHDMKTPIIYFGNIIYNDRDGESKEIDIETIFKELEEFIEEISDKED